MRARACSGFKALFYLHNTYARRIPGIVAGDFPPYRHARAQARHLSACGTARRAAKGYLL
jgi:hypothetical protein